MALRRYTRPFFQVQPCNLAIGRVDLIGKVRTAVDRFPLSHGNFVDNNYGLAFLSEQISGGQSRDPSANNTNVSLDVLAQSRKFQYRLRRRPDGTVADFGGFLTRTFLFYRRCCFGGGGPFFSHVFPFDRSASSSWMPSARFKGSRR